MSFERDNIRKMTGYASGEQPEDPKTIKLNTNENPYPASTRVRDVLDQFDVESLRRYPPATSIGFRQAAAELHGVNPENIIATRGGDELLRLVITTFVDPGERIGMSYPTYSLYPVLAQIQDCPTFEVPLNDDWSVPENFAAEMNNAGVKLTFLVNPHAPSGHLVPAEQITQLAQQLDSILLLDEAYIDFTGEKATSPALAVASNNVIILRTLSKGYSLAGLRFGYGIGPESLIEPMMTKTRDSYNLDGISQQVAEAALRDQEHARKSWKKVISERTRVQSALAEMGFIVPDSHTNFLLATVPLGKRPAEEERVEEMDNAETLYKKLKERHILVRYFNAPRMQDKLRISIGTPEENDRLLNAIREIYGSR
jgi:histidinol-phosphate aminotransferase